MKKKMSLEEVQKNLLEFMAGDEVKPGSKKGNLIERAYVMGLVHAQVEVAEIVYLLIWAGRSVAGYKPTKTN